MGTWDGIGRHVVTRRDTSMETCLLSSSLVVVLGLVYSLCWLGLLPLVVYFIVSFTVPLRTLFLVPLFFFVVARVAQGGRRGHAVRSLLRPVTLPGPLALCPSPASSHHQSRKPICNNM